MQQSICKVSHDFWKYKVDIKCSELFDCIDYSNVCSVVGIALTCKSRNVKLKNKTIYNMNGFWFAAFIEKCSEAVKNKTHYYPFPFKFPFCVMCK